MEIKIQFLKDQLDVAGKEKAAIENSLSTVSGQLQGKMEEVLQEALEFESWADGH